VSTPESQAENWLDVFDLDKPLDEYSPALRELAIKIRRIVERAIGDDDL